MDLQEMTRELHDSFESIRINSEQGIIPDLESAKHFQRLCQRLHNSAPGEWIDEAEDFAHLANELFLAIRHNREQDAILIIDSLGDAYSYLSSHF